MEVVNWLDTGEVAFRLPPAPAGHASRIPRALGFVSSVARAAALLTLHLKRMRRRSRRPAGLANEGVAEASAGRTRRIFKLIARIFLIQR